LLKTRNCGAKPLARFVAYATAGCPPATAANPADRAAHPPPCSRCTKSRPLPWHRRAPCADRAEAAGIAARAARDIARRPLRIEKGLLLEDDEPADELEAVEPRHAGRISERRRGVIGRRRPARGRDAHVRRADFVQSRAARPRRGGKPQRRDHGLDDRNETVETQSQGAHTSLLPPDPRVKRHLPNAVRTQRSSRVTASRVSGCCPHRYVGLLTAKDAKSGRQDRHGHFGVFAWRTWRFSSRCSRLESN